VTPLVLSTDGQRGAAAGAAAMAAGGNAVDAAVAAVLAWPRALMSAGALVAVGTGTGRVACRFPATVPGFGLSRPRRLHLIESGEPALAVAATSAAPGLAAFVARFGTLDLAALVRAVVAAGDEPVSHAAALEALAAEGVDGFVRGGFGAEVARVLGPLGGGLLTRRDSIDARPETVEACTAGDALWSAYPIGEGRRGSSSAAGRRRHALAVVVVDRRGVLVVVALDAGRRTADRLPTVLGVPPNALLADYPAAQTKKVGQALPPRSNAVAGGAPGAVAVAGASFHVAEALAAGATPEPGDGFVRVAFNPGGGVQIDGEAAVLRP
jgi:hypothetical protein